MISLDLMRRILECRSQLGPRALRAHHAGDSRHFFNYSMLIAAHDLWASNKSTQCHMLSHSKKRGYAHNPEDQIGHEIPVYPEWHPKHGQMFNFMEHIEDAVATIEELLP